MLTFFFFFSFFFGLQHPFIVKAASLNAKEIMTNLINSYKGNDDDDDSKTSSAESTMERVSSDSQINGDTPEGTDSYASLEDIEDEEKTPAKRVSVLEVCLPSHPMTQ